LDINFSNNSATTANEKKRNHKNFGLCRGIFLKYNWITLCSALILSCDQGRNQEGAKGAEDTLLARSKLRKKIRSLNF